MNALGLRFTILIFFCFLLSVYTLPRTSSSIVRRCRLSPFKLSQKNDLNNIDDSSVTVDSKFFGRLIGIEGSKEALVERIDGVEKNSNTRIDDLKENVDIKIKTSESILAAKIDDVRKDLNNFKTELNTKIDNKFDNVTKDIDNKFDDIRKGIDNKFDNFRKDIASANTEITNKFLMILIGIIASPVLTPLVKFLLDKFPLI